MTILAIETSCDETAAAVVKIKNNQFYVLSDVVSSQVKIHSKYGGIVPEVAARKQMEMIIPVIEKACQMSNVKCQMSNYIAVTQGPGLITSLRVGVETAKTLSFIWNKPLIAVNHLEGHLYSPLLVQTLKNTELHRMKFPALGLIVSGGHTQLVLLKDYLNYKVVGETQDDAAGEAFDKVAKILGLGYPGGPIISKLAKDRNSTAYDLPRPMINSQDFNFSFSGLKTAVLYLTRNWAQVVKPAPNSRDPYHSQPQVSLPAAIKNTKDLCASFQQAVIDVLITKTIKAAKKYQVKTILLGGGVAANQELRWQLKKNLKEELPLTKYFQPPIKYCGDNATMVAIAAYFKARAKKFTDFKKIKTNPNLNLEARN